MSSYHDRRWEKRMRDRIQKDKQKMLNVSLVPFPPCRAKDYDIRISLSDDLDGMIVHIDDRNLGKGYLESGPVDITEEEKEEIRKQCGK